MIDPKTYFNDFKPKFNRKRFKELINNTPTSFMTPRGNISENKYFVKSVLISCKLLWQELDRNNIYFGSEGSGKSHAVFQHTFIWWWCMKELGMINYEFIMEDLIYAKIQDLMDAMDKYKDIPFMIYTQDESDEISRKNYNTKLVKKFLGKLRKERKNLRVVNLIMPALEEMLPAITMSRINWIIELEMKMNLNFDLERGSYKLLNIPIGKEFYSVTAKRIIKRKEIMNWLHIKYFDYNEKFSALPSRLLAIRGKINSTFVFDKNAYKEWARKKNAEQEEELDKSDNVMQQRNKLIYHLLKECGLKQQEVANIVGLTRSTIGDIKQQMTTEENKV